MANLIQLEHTGIILKEEFMEPFGLSINALATAVRVPANRIHGIIHGTRGISADTDLRLTKFFGLSEGYFLRLAADYETRMAKRKIAKELNFIIPFNKEQHIQAMA